MQQWIKKLRYPLLLISGMLAALGVVYPQYGVLAWISLIPAGLLLLTLGGSAKCGSMYLYGLVFYFVYYVMGYHWFIAMYPMKFAGFEPNVAIGVISLAVFGISAAQAVLSALIFMIFGLFCRTALLQRYAVLKPILLACLWVVNEWSQTIGWTGLPWVRLYLSQCELLPMAQSASLLGGLFVSFLIVAVNLCFAGVIVCRGQRLSFGLLGGCLLVGNLLFGLSAMDAINGNALPWQIGFLLVALATIAVAVVYAAVRRVDTDKRLLKVFLCIGLSMSVLSSLGAVIGSYANPEQTIRAAALQGNLSSTEKFETGGGMRSFNAYAGLTEQAANDGAALIVWPETALAYPLFEISPNSTTQAPLDLVHDLVDHTGATVLISTFVNVQYFDPTAQDIDCNTVVTFYPDSTYDENIYIKRKLVPFGEYVPWRDFLLTVLPVLGELNLEDSDIEKGELAVILDDKVSGAKLGPIICFDSIFEETVRQTVVAGAQIITLSTNDSWFSDSAAIYMHNNQAKFRAIENGRYVVRSANTGVSSIVAPDGRVLDSQEVLTKGLAIADVHARNNTTPYTAMGYLLVWLSFAAQIALVIAQIVHVVIKHCKKQKSLVTLNNS